METQNIVIHYCLAKTKQKSHVYCRNSKNKYYETISCDTIHTSTGKEFSLYFFDSRKFNEMGYGFQCVHMPGRLL